ncbi:unnamed protein product [Lymnaea stagnalis]|uniref:Gem-associated protein 8 n=1 Tax=Lymnaea stagnalis TaxID=6523 RepID=A0AAV2HVV3_LYMST
MTTHKTSLEDLSMAEKGQTSSMTSVTEEDSSPDSESDTTESLSNHTSSVMSSTDTDDKLTPGLINITISTKPTKTRKQQNMVEMKNTDECEAISPVEPDDFPLKNAESETSYKLPLPETFITSYVFPYGSNPLPLEGTDFSSMAYMKKKKGISLPPKYQGQSSNLGEDYGCKENLGLDDTDNKLSTDFSDTSSIQIQRSRGNGTADIVDEACAAKRYKTSHQRPFYPDLSSSHWYQASCFDHYWKHYRFVMDWYQKHIEAIKTLQGQMGAPLFFPSHFNTVSPQRSHHQYSRRNERLKRSRRRSNARTRKEKCGSTSLSVSDEVTGTGGSSGHSREVLSDDENIEMEITEDMVQFFATSLKHKLERDNAKQDSDLENGQERLNIEEARKGQQSHSILAPREQPGVRRATELRELYGAGAPMIHGMETALQMTYDRFSDKFQSKMWPNMPLKIIFT